MDRDRDHGRRQITRAASSSALAALIFAGSLVMWVGVPLTWVWAVSQVADHYPDVYILAVVGCPLTMVLFGALLVRLNAIHLRISGRQAARSRTAWLKSLSGDRNARRQRSVLETSMVVSVVLAMTTLIVWYLLFAHSYTPGLPAP